MSCDMWFGTKEYSRWVPTPQTGADVSASAWSDDGGFLNGAGYALNSRGSHKRYVFSWGSSNARHTAQLFKSYFDGSFGRGKLYLIDPLTTSTNVLPARWADPSIGLDYESPSLVPGTLPTRSSASGFERLQLPVASASYSLTGSPAQTVSKETVVENLFTNPRLVGDGTWAEVRRNRVLNPRAVGGGAPAPWSSNLASSSGWMTGSGLPTPFPDTYRQMIASATAGAGFYGSILGMASPGETVTLGRWVRLGSGGYARLSFEGSMIPGNINGPNTLIPANTWVYLSFTATMPSAWVAGGTTLNVSCYANSITVGSTVDQTGAYVGPPGGYFDGSTMDASMPQPEDFRVRWLGTPNASESVMEIERVAGFTGFTAIAGVSTRAGKPAVRLIRRESETTSGAYALIPVTAPSVTAVGTVSLDAPLQIPPGTLEPTLSTGNASSSAPNLAGDHPLRVMGGEPDSGYAIISLVNGASPGDPDVWWTDIGLYAGDYTGPNFTGADGTVQYNGETLRTEWAGTEDNSVSRAVRFRTTGTPRITENNSLFVPIPDGHQLNLGAFYSASGDGGVWAVSATAGGGIGDVITPLTQLDGTSSNLFPDVITKPPGIIGAYIWIGSVGSSTGSSVTINAMHARISPVGEPPKGENMWIGGQGNEGVRFAGPPTYINVNGRDGGRIEFAATFVESVL